ncbi:phage baseplate assembly protein V [Tibeticola sediminis]|uniref:Phage baseplate assembly protein V n=1 Tax=Tibeticola sediminis TaxID=1917811 RepID=A0A3N4VHX1_9BURK|nr:phage baseplate assembly protein V [Tibeticola sediminis]RPE72534.1 phage baseplate assembly protein V [Tibeticola sediminis]
MSVDADVITLDAADWGRGGTVRLGTVTEFHAIRCRVRVRIAGDHSDGVTTGWLPWATWAAGHLRVWSPPATGEQCLVLAPSGDLAQAVALPAVFEQSGQYPAPSANPMHTLLAWDGGGYIRYERDTGSLHLHAPSLIKITADRVEIN